MPTYEYVCRECGRHVEVVQSFRDDPLTTCGTCGGTLRKVFGTAGIIFKGSGYYVTDSRAKARRDGKSEGADKKSDSGSGSGDTASKDSSAKSA